ncbi:MAG: GNVR domain-containing protein, partial [Bacteroidota bacterium]
RSDSYINDGSLLYLGIKSHQHDPLGSVPGENSESRFMIGVLKSKHLSEQVAADSVMWDGEMQLLADLIIDSRPDFTSIGTYFQYLFTFSHYEYDYRGKIRSAGKEISGSLGVETTEEGFIQLQIASYNSRIAHIISDQYILQLNSYYRKRRTEKASRNVRFFSFRADSIRNELKKVNEKLAYRINKKIFDYRAESQIKIIELESEQGILSQMYVNLILAREQAMAQLQEDIPVIQVLDRAQPPFDIVKPSRIFYIAIGLFLGLFLGVFILTYSLLREDVLAILQTYMKQVEKDNPQPEGAEDVSQADEGV